MHAHTKTRARAFIRAIKSGHTDVTRGLATSQRNALRVNLFRAARSLTRIIREGKRAKIKLSTYILTISRQRLCVYIHDL